MNTIKGKFMFIMGIIMLVMGAFATPAQASDTTIDVLEKASVVGDVSWNGTLTEGWRIHFTAAQKHRLTRAGNCIWADGKNYYSKVDKSHGWHPDVHMHLCRSSKSPTGWVKVGGGRSGLACFNVASPNNVPALPHVPQIKGPITETKSFAKFFEALKVKQGINLHIVTDCGPAHIDTTLWTSGHVKATGLLTVFLSSTGHMRSFNAKLKTALELSAKSSSKVHAIITCSYTPSPNYSAPSVTASANGCVGPDHPTATVNVSFASTNEGDTSADVKFDSQPSKTVTLTSGQGSTTFTVNSAGSYSGTVTVNPSGMSAPFSVTVAQCETPQVAMPAIQVDKPNDVLVGNSRTITAHVKGQAGRTIKVHAFACNGGSISGDQSITADGTWQDLVFTYTAPTEGTPQNTSSGCETPAGQERVNFDATDTQDASLTASTSTQFGITAPNPDPS